MNEYEFVTELSNINNKVQQYKNKGYLSANDILLIDCLSLDLQKLYNSCKSKIWFTEALTDGFASYGINILK